MKNSRSKSLFVFFVFIVVNFSTLFAQSNFFGLQGKFGTNDVFSRDGDNLSDYKQGRSWVLGAFYQNYFDERMSLRVGAQLVKFGLEYEHQSEIGGYGTRREESVFKIYNVGIPVLLGYDFNKFRIFIGTKGLFLIGGKETYKSTVLGKTETGEKDLNEDKLELGANMGCEFELSERLGVAFDFYREFGLFEDPEDYINRSNRQFTLGLNYYLK